MIKMHEKITWLQKRFPELIDEMSECNHHGRDLNPYHLERMYYEI